MTRPARALIDVAALRHNLGRVRALAPGTRVLAIIKANGYGHGMVRVAHALQTADGFGVACLEEALILREAGIHQRIVLLGGMFDVADLTLVDQHRLDLVVHHESQAALLEQARVRCPISIWLKIDTGMHRLGIHPSRLPWLWQRLAGCSNVRQPMRLMTHLASADEPHNPQTPEQLACFFACTEGFASERSLANSAAILAWPAAHGNWVRPGIMLYGISPFCDTIGADLDLRPAMTLGTQLVAVKRVERGGAIGYGGTWVCPETMPIGVAAIGYGDGYPRQIPSGTPVLLNGKPVPVVGRVSMDLITLDLRTQPDAELGDAVVLWGRGLPIEQLAARVGTIAYELVCGIAPRVRFIEEERID